MKIVEYLGDSVYAELNPDGIVLTTENGLADDPSNRIVLEPAVVSALIRFLRKHGVMGGLEEAGRLPASTGGSPVLPEEAA